MRFYLNELKTLNFDGMQVSDPFKSFDNISFAFARCYC